MSTFSMQSLEKTFWEEVPKLYQPMLVIYSARHPREHENMPTGMLSSPSYCWYLFDGCDSDHEEERKAAGYRAGWGVHYHLQTVRADWWQPASSSRISKNSGHGAEQCLVHLERTKVGKEDGAEAATICEEQDALISHWKSEKNISPLRQWRVGISKPQIMGSCKQEGSTSPLEPLTPRC